MLITILDVIDNFFAVSDDPNLLTTSGRTLFEFGEEVRKFAEHYQLPKLEENQHPTYLGGWPSANFWSGINGQLILTSLLYSGQVLVKDPISDWFSDEQYLLPRPLASRPGYRNLDGTFNVIGTRQFLCEVIPILQTMRPLIKTGIIVLVPAWKHAYAKREVITGLRNAIFDPITKDPIEIVKNLNHMIYQYQILHAGFLYLPAGIRQSKLLRQLEAR